MEGSGLYPRIEIEPDARLEERFYDFDSIQSDKEEGSSSISIQTADEEGTSSDLQKVEGEGLPVSSSNHTTFSGKALRANVGLKEMGTQSVFSVKTQTVLDHSTEKSASVSQNTASDYAGESHTVQNCDPDKREETDTHRDQNLGRRFFYYDLPLLEETGVWIPVSVPPMSASDHEEWNRSLGLAGGYFPEEDVGWQQVNGDQELTMWTVVSEMLLVIQEKISSFRGGVPQPSRPSLVTNRLMEQGMLEQAWKEMAQTLTETTFSTVKDILENEPPRWIADSAASACMLCNSRFHPIMCPRHHCRFCGGIFCGICSRGRSLLPVKFRTNDPQRVCDVCWVRLESVQALLMEQVSHAAQTATHDVTDLSTLRSWVNFPWGQSMEHEIYKATNTLRGYIKIGCLRPERSIPDSVLRRAKGLAILTVIKVGLMVTYKVGTGLVIARREDGSWSSPSAISSFGIGWGAQAGGELTDFIIVLRTEEAVKTFSGNMHFSIGAGLSAAAGPVGRVVEADLRAGDGGSAACYTYSCSKGAFVGCSLEGNVVTTRVSANSRFYGNSSINASDILLGSVPRPPAATPLYNALSDLFVKVDMHCKT